jgi:GT2 family glycosyltransferase
VKEYAIHPKRKLENLLKQDMFVLPSASMISRTAFEAVGGFDEQFKGYEDDDLFLRIFMQGYSNYYIDSPVSAWCIHNESTSYSTQMSRSRLRYFKKLATMFPDDPSAKQYYLRDLLIPRFRRLFLVDAMGASQLGRQHRGAVKAALDEFLVMIQSNPNISRYSKAKTRILCELITKCPPTMMHGIVSLSRIAFLKKLRRKLL